MTDVRRVTGAEVVTFAQAPVPRSVSVWLAAGDLAILPCADGEPTRVEVHEVQGPPLAVSLDDQVLRVEHREPGEGVWSALRRAVSAMSLPSARLALVVPAGADVTVRVATAPVYADGLTGTVSVTSVAGPVTVDRASGTVTVSTGAGVVRGTRLSGQLRVKTATGAVDVRRSPLRSARLATLSGRLDLELTQPNCLVTSSTASGPLQVRVAPGTGYDLTARAPEGAVRIDDEAVTAEPAPKAVSPDPVAPIGPAAAEATEATIDRAPAQAPEVDGDPTVEAPGTDAEDTAARYVHRADGDRALVVKARTLSGTVSLRRDL